MKKKEELVTFGLTEKQADEVMLLESRMMEEAVKFRFVKKDGTVREVHLPVGLVFHGQQVLPRNGCRPQGHSGSRKARQGLTR